MSRSKITALANTAEPNKAERVRQELNRLSELFKGISEGKRDFVKYHIEQLAWYTVSVADLQAEIDRAGTSIGYDNGGGQKGVRVNPDIKTLMDYQKNINTITRTLIPLVPESFRIGKLDDFNREFALELDTDDV